MKKFITGLLAGLFLFVITRMLAYLLGLDAIAQRVAHDVLQVPTSELYLVAWLLSGLVGVIALLLWLIFKVDEHLSNILSPRPPMGSLAVAGNPTFKFATNKSTGKSDAELFVDLINKNDSLISLQYELKATVNGKELDSRLQVRPSHLPTKKHGCLYGSRTFRRPTNCSPILNTMLSIHLRVLVQRQDVLLRELNGRHGSPRKSLVIREARWS